MVIPWREGIWGRCFQTIGPYGIFWGGRTNALGGTRVGIAVQSHSRYGKDDMLYENQLPNDSAESLPIPSTSNVIRAASQDIDELARE